MYYLTDEPLVREVLNSMGLKDQNPDGSYSDFYRKLFKLDSSDSKIPKSLKKPIFIWKRTGYIRLKDHGKFMSKSQLNRIYRSGIKGKARSVLDIIRFENKVFNHLNDSVLITDKLNLRDTLKAASPDASDLAFLPLTFEASERKLFETYKKLHPETRWIYKPRYEYGGRGVTFLAKSDALDASPDASHLKEGLVQEYISTPLLYKGRKFDIRLFAMLKGADSSMYIWPNFFCRTSSYKFNLDDPNLYIHVTNNAIQKKGPDFERYEKGNILTYEEFEAHFGKQTVDIVERQMQHIVSQVFDAYIKRIASKTQAFNLFELFGFDFMITEDLKVKLIEVNEAPSLHFGNPKVDAMIKEVIKEVIEISLGED